MIMRYTVLHTLAVGDNTAVTVSGKGEQLKNDITIIAPNKQQFRLISVGLTGVEPVQTDDTTAILVEGRFDATSFTVEAT